MGRVISDPQGTPVAYGRRDGSRCSVVGPEGSAFTFSRQSTTVVGRRHIQADETAVVDAYLDTALPLAVTVVLAHQALHASAVVYADGRARTATRYEQMAGEGVLRPGSAKQSALSTGVPPNGVRRDADFERPAKTCLCSNTEP